MTLRGVSPVRVHTSTSSSIPDFVYETMIQNSKNASQTIAGSTVGKLARAFVAISSRR